MVDPVIELADSAATYDKGEVAISAPTALLASSPTAHADSSLSSSRLGECQSCHAADARYTCPRCSFPSCSLVCSKAHKVGTTNGCDGQAQPVWSRALQANEMTSWGALMRDQSYISSVGRTVEDTGRELVRDKLIPSANHARRGQHELADGPARLDEQSEKEARLVQVAWETSGTRLVLMPRGMSRRVKNQTRWDQKQRRVDWTAEVSFYSAPTASDALRPTTVTLTTPLPSSKTLYDVLKAAMTIRDRDQRTHKGKGIDKGKGKEKEEPLNTVTPGDEMEPDPARFAALERRWLEAQRPDSDDVDVDGEAKAPSGNNDGDEDEEDLEGAFLLLLAPYLPSTPSSALDAQDPAQMSTPPDAAPVRKPHHLVHPSLSLNRALANVCVLEYPSFVLVPKETFARLTSEDGLGTSERWVIVDLPPASRVENSHGADGEGQDSWRGRGRGRGRGLRRGGDVSSRGRGEVRGRGRGQDRARGREAGARYGPRNGRDAGIEDWNAVEGADRQTDNGWGSRASRVVANLEAGDQLAQGDDADHEREAKRPKLEDVASDSTAPTPKAKASVAAVVQAYESD